jgi:hypothetical protein
MPAYYIGEHVVISGTLEGGRRLNWVKTGNSPMSEVSLFYPQQRTFQIQHYANNLGFAFMTTPSVRC